MRAIHLLACLLMAASQYAMAGEVRLVTLEYPPYTTQTLTNQGSMIELTKRAFAAVGHTAHIDFRPWARAQQEMRQSKYDGILLLWPEEVSAAQLIASRPLAYSELGFFVRTDTPVAFTELGQLKGQRVGVARGYDYPDSIMDSGVVPEEAVDDLTNLRKLAARRFDLVLLERQVGLYLLELHPELQGKIAWQGQTLVRVPLFIGFAEPKPDQPDWPALYAEGLKVLLGNGEYLRILRSSSPTP